MGSDARAADTRLHAMIAECSREFPIGGRDQPLSRLVPGTTRRVSSSRRRYQLLACRRCLEHLAIIGPLLESDPEAAAKAMDRHIRSATVTLEEVVFRDRDNSGCSLGGSRSLTELTIL